MISIILLFQLHYTVKLLLEVVQNTYVGQNVQLKFIKLDCNVHNI